MAALSKPMRFSSPGSAHNSHIVSTVGIILSVVLTISAAAFSVAALVRYGESEVANPLWVVCGLLVFLQGLLFSMLGKARKNRTFLVLSGASLGLAAIIAVLAYVPSVKW